MEIIQEFDTWRKIRDIDGEEGWVHQSLLTSKRFAIHNTGETHMIFKKPNDASRPVAGVESGAVLKVDSCENQWCLISSTGYKGWIPSSLLWGVYEGEQIQ